MAVWDDPKELGKRLAAARGYHRENQAKYGTRIGRTAKTVGAMERGEPGSVGRSVAARKKTAEIAVAAGAPPEFFGLNEPQNFTQTELAELRRLLDSSRDDPPEAHDGVEGD